MRRFACLILGVIFSLPAVMADSKIRTQDLPLAVQTAMKEQVKGATILGASEEREKGQMTYEIETKLNGKSRDLTFDGSGSLLEVEQEVDLDSIPALARKAIQTKAAGGTIRKVESVTHGSSVSYEAVVRTSIGAHSEVAVNPDGSPHKDQ